MKSWYKHVNYCSKKVNQQLACEFKLRSLSINIHTPMNAQSEENEDILLDFNDGHGGKFAKNIRIELHSLLD